MTAKQKKQTLAAFSANLRAQRDRAGITQLQLAKAAGISVPYVSLLERAGRNPPLTLVTCLASCLSCSPADLVKAA